MEIPPEWVVRDVTFPITTRFVDDDSGESERGRRLLAAKYQGWHEGPS